MEEIKSYNMSSIVEKYGAMRNATTSLQDVEDGQVLHVDAWMLYEDADRETGELKTLLTIKSDGKQYTTISNTFIREFTEAWDFFEAAGETVQNVAVLHGESKAGRAYVTCEVR